MYHVRINVFIIHSKLYYKTKYSCLKCYKMFHVYFFKIDYREEIGIAVTNTHESCFENSSSFKLNCVQTKMRKNRDCHI